MADNGWGVTFDYATGSISLPSMHLLGPGMEVLSVQSRGISEQDIVDALP